jgi:hypothetical protein
MDWTTDEREEETALRLLGFDSVQLPSFSAAILLRCANADRDDAAPEESEIRIRLSPSQARALARALAKLALETEATLFDTP